MSYLGIGDGSPSSENQYGSSGLFNQPMYLTLGTVINSYQAAQYCEIALDTGGRRLAIALGLGRGFLGANESGGFMPGERVIVACSFASTAPAVVLGRYDSAKAGEYAPPCNLLVYPQVAGFEYGARMSGRTYADFPRAVRNFIAGPADTVDGDWVMSNMFGGAVGVEAFRTFLRGGPASGFYCYTEDQTVKIIGSKIEFISFSETSTESETGDSTLRVQKRYLTPGDQFTGYQAQIIRFTGKAAGGEQAFTTYPDGMNGSGAKAAIESEAGDDKVTPEEGVPEGVDIGKSRIALIHEYRGADGSYALSAANSILLQKTMEIPVPIDVIEADARVRQQAAQQEEQKEEKEKEEGAESETGKCGCDSCGLTPNPDPLFCSDPNEEQQPTSKPVFRYDSNAVGDPLAFAINARGMADRLIRWQAVGGLTNLARFALGANPDPELFGERTPGQLLVSKSPDMWKCMPQSIKLGLQPSGKAKRMYLGRALISITEDGSLVLQDAQGSQIMMSGGNIYLSAQHDIIRTAGRNLLDISGRDTAVRAGRHCDVLANEGRLTMVAGNQATLVGGLDGHGGVLVESKGQHQATIDTGENPPTSGGLILRSNHFVGVRAAHVAIKAKAASGWSSRKDGVGLVTIDADERVSVRSVRNRMTMSLGLGFNIMLAPQTQNERGHGLFYDGTSLLCTGSVTAYECLYYYQMIRMRSTGAVVPPGSTLQGRGGFISRNIERDMNAWCSDDLTPYRVSDTSPLQAADFKAKWLSSSQYNIDGYIDFSLPQPEWQTRANSAFEDNSTLRNSVMYDNQMEETAPLPGADAWTTYGFAGVSYTPPAWGEIPVVNFSLTVEAIDGKLFKGI